jgi:hypothetical protein
VAEFEIDIPVKSAGVEPAAAAVARLADKLTGAQSAASKAAEAVKAGEASYKAAELSADRAAKAVERIGVKADAQRGKMAAAMQAGDEAAFWRAAGAAEKLAEKQAEATARAEEAKGALFAQAVALDALKSNAESAASAVDSAAKESAAAAKAAKVLEQEEAAAAKALDEAAKAAAKTAREFADVQSQAAAAARGTGNLTDSLDGLSKLSGPLGSTAGKAKNAAQGFKKLTASMGSAGPYVAIAAALVAITVGLAAMAAAAVASIAKVTWWAIKLSDKEGEIQKQTDRLKASFKKLFSGLKVDKVIKGFTLLADLFDETNAFGQSIKVVFESLFQPLVDSAADVLPKVRTAFIKFQIQVMKALIAIKPWGSTIAMVAKVLGVMALVVGGALVVAIGALVVGLTMTAFWIGALIAAGAALVAGLVWLTAKFFELQHAVGAAIGEAIGDAVKFLQDLDLKQIGTDMIDGLIKGILAAGPALLKSITGVADGAVKAAKKALGIASPSKVFAEIGTNTGEGFTEGVSDSTGDASAALESLVSPPAAAESGPAEAPAATGGGGGNVFHVQITGGDTAKANIDAFVEWFESIGAQAGTAVPNA